MSSDNGLTFEEENNAPMCLECGGEGCSACGGFGYIVDMLDDEYLLDDEDARDAYYEYDDEYLNGFDKMYTDEDMATVRLTLRGRWFIWRWFVVPEFFARLRFHFWYARYRIKSKIRRVINRNPYDEIPF